MPICLEKSDYLGHIVSRQGVKADSSKLQAMLDWPTLKIVKNFRSFLGLTDYYKKFIKGHGLIAAPLISLLKKNSFLWNNQAEEAFQALQNAVTRPPVLRLPIFLKFLPLNAML